MIWLFTPVAKSINLANPNIKISLPIASYPPASLLLTQFKNATKLSVFNQISPNNNSPMANKLDTLL